MKNFFGFFKRHKWLTALLILALAALLVKIFIFPNAEAVNYKEETVTLRDISAYNSFVGNIESSDEIAITSRASQRIVKLNVEVGDTVKAGDVIAELDTKSLLENIELKEKSIALSDISTENNIKTAQIAYDDALEAYDENDSEANEKKLDSAKRALDALLDSKKVNDQVNALQLKSLKDSLSDYQIVADEDGIITALNIDEGSMVSAGMTVGRIANLSALQIAIKIDEYSVLHAKVGLPVKIYVDSTKSTYDGAIEKISKTATVQSGVSYFEATVLFTADEKAYCGMSVEVRLTTVDEKQVPTVLAEAIQYSDDNSAYVITRSPDGKTTTSPVELGASDGKYVRILNGLSVGDKILYVPSVKNPVMEHMMQETGSN